MVGRVDEKTVVVPRTPRYNDGVQWHDVPCFFRAKIICEDSEKQMKRIMRERGVDVRTPINDTSV